MEIYSFVFSFPLNVLHVSDKPVLHLLQILKLKLKFWKIHRKTPVPESLF